MKQARVPTEAEFKRLVAVVSQNSYGPRNRMTLMLSYRTGLRVGEIASLRWGDLLENEGKVREQLRLSAAVHEGRAPPSSVPQCSAAQGSGAVPG